jgi:hypothetical protein
MFRCLSLAEDIHDDKDEVHNYIRPYSVLLFPALIGRRGMLYGPLIVRVP